MTPFRTPGATARRAATGTTATVALAAVALTATAGSAQADERWTVRSGDTVSHIATRTGASVSSIARANGLTDPSMIRIGQVLRVPTAKAPSHAKPANKAAAPRQAATYTVRPGDTVSAIAHRHSSTVAAISKANRLDGRALIMVGQRLTIPGAGGTGAKPASSSSTTATRTRTHTVVAGDTVARIAARYGTTTSAVVRANGLDSRALIRIGQRLTIPGAAAASSTGGRTDLVGSTFAGRTYASSVVRAANANKAELLSRHLPSKAQMKAKVAATARAMGLDPALALAIAYQESGFQMSSVSPANAVGVMQVIPSAGDWASQMVGRDLDLLDPEDNVVAGVAILRALVRQAPDQRTAIAGYYQGLAGVLRNGMNPDTRRYVANVQTLMRQFR